MLFKQTPTIVEGVVLGKLIHTSHPVPRCRQTEEEARLCYPCLLAQSRHTPLTAQTPQQCHHSPGKAPAGVAIPLPC